MTDLEMTKLCAEALGYTYGDKQPNKLCYDPLNDDGQAMALAKRFLRAMVRIERTADVPPHWSVTDNLWLGMDNDLNRAIVKCVAKMALDERKKLA